MKRVIIVQARMTSTRLPGKILRSLAGRPMLAQQLQRLKSCSQVDDILIATTCNTEDDAVVELALQEGVGWHRGDEHDVLGRYVGAARIARADVVVRVTADCPLIDPQVADNVILELVRHADTCDYASNVINRTYPKGLDVEAFYYDTLLRFDRFGRSAAAREHVTLAARSEYPELFLCRSVEDKQNNADLRWTVDTAADLEMTGAIYDALGLNERLAPYTEILDYARAHPEIGFINQGVETWEPPQPAA